MPLATRNVIDRVLSAAAAFTGAHPGGIALALLLAGLVLAGTAAAQKSVTVDEFQFLPHGLALLKTGDFHLDVGVPPLSNELAALPLLLTSAKLDTSSFADCSSSWQCGRQFMEENAGRYHEYFLCGRSASLACWLLTCLFAYGLARSLYGGAGGLVTAAVVAFSPNLLAHGPLVTPDIYLTAALIGSLWAFDGMLRRPGWAAGSALGTALGAASLAKYTGLLLFAIFPLLVLGFQMAGRSRPAAEPASALARRRFWLSLGFALVLGVLVINLGYGFGGSLTALQDFRFTTRPFRLVQQLMPGWLPVPLPYPFVQGMDTQLAEGGYTAYLLGDFNQTGFRHYYLVGLLVKTPVPVLLLCALAFLVDRRVGRREVPMLVTAALICGFFSLTRHKNIGMRYVLFLEPLMAIWIGRVASAPAWVQAGRQALLVWVTVASAACLLFLSLVMWPDYLAYFNWVSGGPANGHRYLLDSNLDWGQDLIALRRYLERQGIGTVDLAYFGRVDPQVYGIAYRNLDPDAPGRYVAISANLLWGRMYFVNGTDYWPPDRDTYRSFRRRKPQALLGYSIYVFDLGPEPL
jgi:hypothetical protein